MIRNIYGVAVDTMSLDAGGGLERKWVAHTTFLGSNVWALENLANVHKLRPKG